MTRQMTQRERLQMLFGAQPILRARELRAAGIAAETISRAVANGEIAKIAHGLYQRPDIDTDADQNLAEVAKRVPKGVIAMVSALAFHGLTDQMPRRIWIAIGTSDWAPAIDYPPVRIVRLSDKYLRQGIERHAIAGVDVPIYSVPKTLADLFRNSRLVDRSVAVEGLRAALEQHRASPGAIADAAVAGGTWTRMKPYLEALTSNG